LVLKIKITQLFRQLSDGPESGFISRTSLLLSRTLWFSGILQCNAVCFIQCWLLIYVQIFRFFGVRVLNFDVTLV